MVVEVPQVQVMEKIVEVPQVQTVEKIVQAPAPIIETVMPAPTYTMPAPIVETIAPAPIMTAPIVETIAPTPIYAAPAPMLKRLLLHQSMLHQWLKLSHQPQSLAHH